MSVDHLYVLVEELSMERALHHILPRLLGETLFSIVPFQGKPDLLKKLPDRLRAYSKFLNPSDRIIVLVDRDRENCISLKKRLEDAAVTAGLITRSSSTNGSWQVSNRIAIEELESWYFGDWQAVIAAYPNMSPGVPNKAQFRTPDTIKGGTAEAFQRLASKAGYFRGGPRKTEAAEAIAERMNCEENSSRSFQAFRDVIVECASSTD